MELYAKENLYATLMKRTHDDVIIKVEDLKVWTPEEKSWWRQKPTKPSTVILDNVTGCIRRNEFAAIIGPSGAGKTTFIVSLAGKCTLPSSGKVTLYGKNVKECTGAVEIVPQQEVFMDRLSVMEHLAFMTEMKLGSHKDPDNVTILNALIKEFKLKSNMHTLVSALSGGERRLLSLACSLLSDPRILVCDEPTTGLDSYSALRVIGVLKKLSLDGKTVICSIHQPSSGLFKEFSSIFLMAEGKLLYHGTQDEYRNAFASIGLHCPKNYNPSEFYMRAVSKSSDNIPKLLSLYENQLEMCGGIIQEQIQCRTSQRNWFKQVQLLVWRLSLTLKRGVLRDQLTQLFITVIITAMVLGVAYAGITGMKQRDVQNVRGFLWLITSELSFGLSYISLYAFANELTLFRREVGMYQCSAYFVSKLLSYVPRCIVWPIALVSVTTLAMDLPNHVVTALEFIVTLTLGAIPSAAYGLGMGALFVSTGILDDVMPCVDLPLFLMSGAFLHLSSLPTWLYPVKYISHFYYSMDAMSNIYWRQIDYIKCPANATSCVHDGAAVLSGNGYSENFVLHDLLGFFFVTLFWSVLGYFGLKREERKGYAY